MERLYEKDHGGATYRSRDPIKNFKIRIKLKRLSSSTLGFLGQGRTEEGEQTNSVPTPTNQFGQTVLEEEEMTVHWQQKLFSQRETEFYGFEPNCTTVHDYKYHAEVEKIKQTGGRVNNRLFTYLDSDRFAVVEDAFVPLTTSKNEEPSTLNNRVMEVRQRKRTNQTATPPPWELNKTRNVSGMKMVEKAPSDEFKSNHHVIGTPVHTFILMADLSPEGQLGSAEYERRICAVEYDDNFVMRVTPDFTRSRPPYRLEGGGLIRDIWECHIEHASNDVSKLEARREAKVISELYRKHQNYLKSLVGEDFETVPRDLFRLVVYGEILAAESFEYNDLHVEYFLDVPTNWSTDPTQLLSGCTHTCRTTLSGDMPTAYFSQPFDYQLLLSLNDEDPNVDWPKMFLHVISSDTWGRRRTEGYGYFVIPTTPGVHNVEVQCWRPTGNGGYPSIQAELRRFFVGGNPELEDVTYTSVPSTFEGKHLSKYGLRTESSGRVRIRLNCVQQCQGFQDSLSTEISRKKLQSALQLVKGRASQTAILGAMDAYQRARKRMQLARENVPSQVQEAAQKTAADRLRGMTLEDKMKNVLSKIEKSE